LIGSKYCFGQEVNGGDCQRGRKQIGGMEKKRNEFRCMIVGPEPLGIFWRFGTQEVSAAVVPFRERRPA